MTETERIALYNNYYYDLYDKAVKHYYDATMCEDEKRIELLLNQACEIFGFIKLIDTAVCKNDITIYEAIKLLSKVNKNSNITA